MKSRRDYTVPTRVALLENDSSRHERKLDQLEQVVDAILEKLTTLAAKVAVYAAIGGALAGAVVGAIAVAVAAAVFN